MYDRNNFLSAWTGVWFRCCKSPMVCIANLEYVLWMTHCNIHKFHEVLARRRRKFLGTWEMFLRKKAVPECILWCVFHLKTPPNPPKIPPAAGQKMTPNATVGSATVVSDSHTNQGGRVTDPDLEYVRPNVIYHTLWTTLWVAHNLWFSKHIT